MKNYKIILALGISALSLASCADKAFINGVLADAPGKDLVIAKLDINSYSALDTIKTKGDGSFSYSLKMAEGEPEFVYIYYGQKRIAGLLLEAGEKVQVKADTLGNYETSGSEGSEKLAQVDAAQKAFIEKINAATTNVEITKAFVERNREARKYVMCNQKSLSVIPVLFEKIGEGLPLFSAPTDAIMFRNTVDSLKTVYPNSSYVRSLEKEAVRRESSLEVNNRFSNAEALGYPDIEIPDISGKKVALSSLGNNKVVLVHFWSSEDPTHSMLNNEALLPLYKEYHPMGFEIYSVCVDPDKAKWGGVVTAQKLPWINVNDGLGRYSPALTSYNVSSIPASFFIVNGEVSTPATDITSVDALKREIGTLLRR